MFLRPILKKLLQKFGLRIYTRISFPPGIDLESDLRRFLPGHAFKTLFDIGANRGQTAAQFISQFPEAESIHCFEPIQAVFEELKRVTAPFHHVSCHHLAMGMEEKTVRFTPSPETVRTSLLYPEITSEPTEEVLITRMDTFCVSHNISEIDLLKIDAEGMDLEVLKGAEPLLQAGKIHSIFVEIGFLKNRVNKGEWVPTRVPITDISDYLYDLGFTLVTIYDTTWRPKHDLLQASGMGNGLFVRNNALRPVSAPS